MAIVAVLPVPQASRESYPDCSGTKQDLRDPSGSHAPSTYSQARAESRTLQASKASESRDRLAIACAGIPAVEVRPLVSPTAPDT